MTPTIRDIAARVSEFYGLTPALLIAPSRKRRIARPRQVAMYLSRRLTKRSLPEIGRLFGGLDHTTVLHATRRVTHLMQMKSEFALEVAHLAERIVNPRPRDLSLDAFLLGLNSVDLFCATLAQIRGERRVAPRCVDGFDLIAGWHVARIATLIADAIAISEARLRARLAREGGYIELRPQAPANPQLPAGANSGGGEPAAHLSCKNNPPLEGGSKREALRGGALP